jgi:hypothetical protein
MGMRPITLSYLCDFDFGVVVIVRVGGWWRWRWHCIQQISQRIFFLEHVLVIVLGVLSAE